MITLAPWMVPVGAILFAAFFAFCVYTLDEKTGYKSDTAALLIVMALGVIVMAIGSLTTMYWLF